MSRFLSVLIVCLAGVALADPVKYELDGNKLKVPFAVTFATGKPTLKADSSAAIGYVQGYLDAKTYISAMRIEVHSDDQGDDKANQTLTEKRALAVAKALVAKGIDCKRLVPVGFGETKPVSGEKTPEGRAQNRRTEFHNAMLRGRAIGGMPVDGGGVIAGDPCAK